MARVTVEDCLPLVDNRFALVLLATKRARQLMAGGRPRIEAKDKPPGVALREGATGKGRFDRPGRGAPQGGDDQEKRPAGAAPHHREEDEAYARRAGRGGRVSSAGGPCQAGTQRALVEQLAAKLGRGAAPPYRPELQQHRQVLVQLGLRLELELRHLPALPCPLRQIEEVRDALRRRA